MPPRPEKKPELDADADAAVPAEPECPLNRPLIKCKKYRRIKIPKIISTICIPSDEVDFSLYFFSAILI